MKPIDHNHMKLTETGMPRGDSFHAGNISGKSVTK